MSSRSSHSHRPHRPGPTGNRVATRNARFQQWQALLQNRTKRTHQGEFLVHGVRPITLAVEHGWPLRALLRPADASLSAWAHQLMDQVRTEQPDAEQVEVTSELLRELGEKSDEPPELVAVAAIPPDRLDRIDVPANGLGVVFDRPTNPGNVGTLVRSADAFGACGVVVTGHAADVYDPKAVRASTGSLFAVPTVRAAAPRDVLDWVDDLRAGGVPMRILGTDESGSVEVDAADLTGPTLLVVGNETRGMSVAWRDACDEIVRIPTGGTASSLNAAVAATVVFYEVDRQRRRLRREGEPTR
ncbi:TrmH family RNA methyltransferase [Actinopolymorpha pittospori]|uniref:TrmH family RNA methyltransferase n=1 Tax=Actinopolymorpha pittospori TaxID=648752 RepID=A0A927MUD7_9ACTN|nr:TrmH family RNA methyltransferase [Actinopolymorpha pittospori]